MAIKQDLNNIYNYQAARIEALNKRIYQLYVDSRDKILADLLKYRASVVSGGKVNTFKEQRYINLIKEINKEIGDLTGKSYNLIQSNYMKTYESTYYLNNWAIEKHLNTALGLSYNLRLPALNKKAIEASFNQRIGGLLLRDRSMRTRNVLQYLVQDAVGQNIVEGQSISALNKNLKLINEAMDAGFSNTQRIARTEALKAYSLGQEESRIEAEESGVEFEYIWSAALDNKTRPDHAAMDQKPPSRITKEGVPIWIVGGVEMTGPRTPLIETGSKAEAKQVINCRCRRLDIPFGIKPTKRAAKTKEGKWVEVNGDLTAQEWIKKEYGVNLK